MARETAFRQIEHHEAPAVGHSDSEIAAVSREQQIVDRRFGQFADRVHRICIEIEQVHDRTLA